MIIFLVFLLCTFVALATWIAASEQHENDVAKFNTEIQQLYTQLNELSDERKDLQFKIKSLSHSLRMYEHTLERSNSVEEDTKL